MRRNVKIIKKEVFASKPAGKQEKNKMKTKKGGWCRAGYGEFGIEELEEIDSKHIWMEEMSKDGQCPHRSVQPTMVHLNLVHFFYEN